MTLGGLRTLGKAVGRFFQSPALGVELEQVSMVHQSVEQGCDDGRALLVAAHERVGEFVTGGARQLADEQITDDQQVGDVTFPDAGLANGQYIFMRIDELEGGDFEDLAFRQARPEGLGAIIYHGLIDGLTLLSSSSLDGVNQDDRSGKTVSQPEKAWLAMRRMLRRS